jgi:tetratricopeptide (TPR) repeat protein
MVLSNVPRPRRFPPRRASTILNARGSPDPPRKYLRMTPDLYAPCPCGSGKKFKWCCQPVYADINRALEQDANGQEERAQRLMDQVVQKHPRNPEAWGQKARLLFSHGKVDQAEEALAKAFEINPNYPFGLWLRAFFRYQEGETRGALLLARKAADAYDPDARDRLAEVYRMIFDCEMRRNCPVAARAALRLVAHYSPADEEVRTAFDNVFGEQAALPLAARRDYTLLSPPPGLAGTRRSAWDHALANRSTPRLSDLANVFEGLTQQDADDGPAWFNLALSRAWLGQNAPALEALDRYLALAPEDATASDAAALGEVLRLAEGMEEESDYHEYFFQHQLSDPQPVQKLLDDWVAAHRLIPVNTGQEGALAALVLEPSAPAIVTAGGPGTPAGGVLAGYLFVAGRILRFTGPVKERFDRVKDEVRQRLGLGPGELKEGRGHGQFRDVVSEALFIPPDKVDEKRVLEHAQKFYEDTWVRRPRRSLAGNTPVDAVGSPKLRKQLRGVIDFIEQCARVGVLVGYDFNRLRRKLGLLQAPPTPEGQVPQDLGALGASELAGLDAQKLSDEQLEQAYQSAHRLDAQELAAHFARTLIGRPARPDRPDRYPWYAFLTQKALREGDPAAALDLVNEGERVDCEQNEGRRRNDYELRRGQVLVKQGDADSARDVFRRLIDRVPGELRYRSQAAEAMLSLNQPARALEFAESGLEAARKQNDRDAEQHLMELAAAARKKMGP